MEVQNSGSLGSKRQTDRFKPNKKGHRSPYRAFKGLGGMFVPGYFTYFNTFSICSYFRVHHHEMAMGKRSSNGG
jgi:hypothetical protein